MVSRCLGHGKVESEVERTFPPFGILPAGKPTVYVATETFPRHGSRCLLLDRIHVAPLDQQGIVSDILVQTVPLSHQKASPMWAALRLAGSMKSLSRPNAAERVMDKRLHSAPMECPRKVTARLGEDLLFRISFLCGRG